MIADTTVLATRETSGTGQRPQTKNKQTKEKLKQLTLCKQDCVKNIHSRPEVLKLWSSDLKWGHRKVVTH